MAIDTASLRELAQALMSEARVTTDSYTDLETEMPQEFDEKSLVGLLLTSLNGQSDLPEQKVRVEFLTRDQLLVLPVGLGVHLQNAQLSEATDDRSIAEKYWRVATMPYADIKGLVEAEGEKKVIMETVLALPLPTRNPEPIPWESEDYYMLDDGSIDNHFTRSLVFGLFSRALRLNFDIRDTGFLVHHPESTRMTDAAWMASPVAPIKRLSNNLEPYTSECIAALNYEACDSWHLPAWVRAYAVGCGVLPANNTRLIKEWKFTRAAPSDRALKAVNKAHDYLRKSLMPLCMNLVAMFGLLHLKKNHTYKSSDANMERICTSYLQTLRTMVPTKVIDDMKGKMEVMCMTAVHPFGLSQTYNVAKIMAAANALASPLAIRIDVTPPPVQRIMIADAAMKEWVGFPVGQLLNQSFSVQKQAIDVAVVTIKENPPAFSELYEYYGFEKISKPDKVGKDAADALMPIVCGYANAMHIDESQRRDGLAQELCFLNVERDAKASISNYTNMWKDYADQMDSGGLEKFVKKAMESGVYMAPVQGGGGYY